MVTRRTIPFTKYGRSTEAQFATHYEPLPDGAMLKVHADARSKQSGFTISIKREIYHFGHVVSTDKSNDTQDWTSISQTFVEEYIGQNRLAVTVDANPKATVPMYLIVTIEPVQPSQ